ncbi:DUF427 domain-containing protein [Geitlerinema sp. PCC 9228]|jgi:uncharacterized protein (DUF427 family)|uniref:DUF427 domain-containing protein n=1 Tax=Geitlerinema sp. PCC 9228 TaxID=111611 RepID=UPI0008F9BE8E|nr:DUF427 domain-containing protein [Geitlerinema sp. PCC 9228]
MQSERIQPGPGQESVWDYPRPPRVEPTSKHVRVIFHGTTIADTQRAQRVLETSHPPTYYIPLEDVKTEYLFPTSRTSFCEWKGRAKYYTIKVGDREATNAAWQYPQANENHAAIRDCIAVYPSKMDACYVDDERVQPQAGDFYGGWITSDIVGPFKGGPGTWGW